MEQRKRFCHLTTEYKRSKLNFRTLDGNLNECFQQIVWLILRFFIDNDGLTFEPWHCKGCPEEAMTIETSETGLLWISLCTSDI